MQISVSGRIKSVFRSARIGREYENISGNEQRRVAGTEKQIRNDLGELKLTTKDSVINVSDDVYIRTRCGTIISNNFDNIAGFLEYRIKSFSYSFSNSSSNFSKIWALPFT